MSNQFLTINEVREVTGLSIPTIRDTIAKVYGRFIPANEAPPTGKWLIPADAVEAIATGHIARGNDMLAKLRKVTGA